MNMKNLLVVLLIALTIQCAYTQTTASKSVFDCIYDATDANQSIQLETNWNKLLNQKLSEEYIPGKITLQVNGAPVTFEVKMRARGNMRKQVCYYPPLKLDFKRKDLLEHGLDSSQNKLKLVFQCRSGEANDELLMREKLGYALYQVVQPKYSIQYKQVKIDCTDEGKSKYVLDAMALEDEKHLAKRANGIVIENGKLMASALEKDVYQKMSVFEYMIGNTDWSIPNKHNVEMIKVPEFPRVVPIAYDFDYAALVNAPYAVPHESLPITSIQERYFMGRGVTEADAVLQGKWFADHKSDFYKAVDDCTGLNDKAKKNIKSFLDDFFQIAGDEKKAKNNLSRM